MASSQAKKPFLSELRAGGWSMVISLVNEGHLVDFAKRGDAGAHASQTRFAQKLHAFLFGDALDFGSWPLVDDHLADAIGKVEQLGDCGAAMKAAAGTFQAAGAFIERNASPFFRIQA